MPSSRGWGREPWAMARRSRPSVSVRHEPVLLRETLGFLSPRRGLYLDATFRELPAAHAAVGAERLAGALFDLGVSSRQIDDAARGMSYLHAGPLDLRMDASRGTTLADRLASTTETELAEVLRGFGDVGPAHALARAILAAARDGALRDTRALAVLVQRVLRDSHPAAAAPVFQAL